MTTERDFDRIARTFMADGPTQLADRVLDSSLADVHLTRQRRADLRPPWRTPVMNIYAKVAAAAVVIVAVGALGLAVLRPGSSSPPVGAVPTETVVPSTSPEPSAASSSGPTAPPLSGSFTSTRHGISLATPAGWTARAATESATADSWSSFLGYDQPSVDVIRDPVLDGELWLGIESIHVDAVDADSWASGQFASTQCPRTEPVTVDGALGYVGGDFHSTECTVAFVATSDRGYQIRLYDSNDEGAYTRDWFDDVLATVKLTPEDAVD